VPRLVYGRGAGVGGVQVRTNVSRGVRRGPAGSCRRPPGTTDGPLRLRAWRVSAAAVSQPPPPAASPPRRLASRARRHTAAVLNRFVVRRNAESKTATPEAELKRTQIDNERVKKWLDMLSDWDK
jgi:hypothetical protein